MLAICVAMYTHALPRHNDQITIVYYVGIVLDMTFHTTVKSSEKIMTIFGSFNKVAWA